MAEYHVKCKNGIIYAGIRKNKKEWRNKSIVTDEAIQAAIEYLLDEDSDNLIFYIDGKTYQLKVERC